jgi:hypothetical protein
VIITEIPDSIDLSQQWLVDYWAGEFKVSSDCVRRAVALAKTDRASRVRRELKEGYRIAIVEDGKTYCVARVAPQAGGFHLVVPYFRAQEGMLLKIPYDYSKVDGVQKFDLKNTYRVSSRAKLSFHMGGFVQFSSADKKRIISGYNEELGQIKGVGLRGKEPVVVTTGPLCGLIVQGLSGFAELGDKGAEVFEPADLWHHPKFSSPSDTAYNLEFFLCSRVQLQRSSIVENKRLLRRLLPFRSEILFPFTLRMLEFPDLPFGLGLIVSRFFPDPNEQSCYKISGPGCFDEQRNAFGIAAWYPFPKLFEDARLASLDYEPGDAKAPPASPQGDGAA